MIEAVAVVSAAIAPTEWLGCVGFVIQCPRAPTSIAPNRHPVLGRQFQESFDNGRMSLMGHTVFDSADGVD